MNIAKIFDRLNTKVIATVLITKVIILGFAYQAYQIVTDQPLVGLYRFFDIWRRWDADNYLRLAEQGYSSVGDQRFLIVFFPLFPALSALVSFVTGDALIAAFVVSTLASVVLGLVFHRLVRLDHSERVAQMSVLFLFIFPTSYFLHIPYTESLFLALVIGSFYAARSRMWIIAGVLGGLACMTRINGLVLIPALAFEVWAEYRETKKIDRRWAALLMIPTGFGLYLGRPWFYGSPFYSRPFAWGPRYYRPYYGRWHRH